MPLKGVSIVPQLTLNISITPLLKYVK